MLALTLSFAACCAQDGGTLLGDAIDKLKEAEGFSIKGTLGRKDSMGDMGGPFRMGFGMMGEGGGGKPFEGEFSGKFRGDKAELHGQAKGGSFDVYRVGDKTVKRQSWTKETLDIDGFAGEAFGALNLDALKKAVRDGKFEEVREEGGDKVIEGTLPAEAFEKKDEDENPNEEDPMRMARKFMHPKLKEVKVSARIDGETGRLKSLSLALTRELDFGGMGGFRFRMERGGGGGGDEEAPGPGEMPKFSMTTKLEFSVEGAGADHAPKIPEDLQKLLEDAHR
ncbi:MAG TPA: hypothetical protein VI643_05885 [Planctomycetota bacterium]|nr:hypothetical protein [Planctomycetota bacterium]